MVDNNVNKLKLAKFESYIEKISNGLEKYGWWESISARINFYESYLSQTGILPLLWGGEDMNEYSVIINNIFSELGFMTSGAQYLNLNIQVSASLNGRIEQICEINKEIKESRRSIVLIFALLMSLAVDKTDYEERLSTVCDVAVMLDISDDEMADIVQVVRFVYRDIKAEDFALKTDRCKQVFRHIVDCTTPPAAIQEKRTLFSF